jgi:hypothetical protein
MYIYHIVYFMIKCNKIFALFYSVWNLHVNYVTYMTVNLSSQFILFIYLFLRDWGLNSGGFILAKQHFQSYNSFSVSAITYSLFFSF